MNGSLRALRSTLRVDTSDAGFTAIDATSCESYKIHFGPIERALAGEFRRITRAFESPSIHLITDETVAGLHLGRVRAAVHGITDSVHTVEVPAGEGSKSPETLVSLWNALLDQKAARRSLVVAVGGGVVCDVVSLAAATYMRGMPYVTIPTTLLAQVDAALGGKAGIDLAGVKNLVGAFHHPAAVFIDPDFLHTLPRAQMSNGFAEIVKTALISDPELLLRMQRVGAGLLDSTNAELPEIIKRSGDHKMRLLAADPFEKGSLARLLNLGHCIGHPLEAASGYRIPHGYAVAVGMAEAAAIGHVLGVTEQEHLLGITELLTELGLPIHVPGELRESTWHGLTEVTRIRNGLLRLVVPTEPGRCITVENLDRKQFEAATLLLEEVAVPPTATREIQQC